MNWAEREGNRWRLNWGEALDLLERMLICHIISVINRENRPREEINLLYNPEAFPEPNRNEKLYRVSELSINFQIPTRMETRPKVFCTSEDQGGS